MTLEHLGPAGSAMAPTTRLNRIQTPEKNLLNEIAYLTNLIESSKRTDAKALKSWKGQSHPYNFPGKSSRSFKRVNIHSKVNKNAISSVVSKSPAPLSPSSVKSVPPAPLPEKVTKVTSDPPRRYYEVKASASTVQRVVQRRLPSDLIQSLSSKVSECNQVQEESDKVEVNPSGSSSGINLGQISSKVSEVSKFDKPDKDQEYQTKRSRLLGHLSKLTSHKERLRGQKSNSVPDYLPC